MSWNFTRVQCIWKIIKISLEVNKSLRYLQEHPLSHELPKSMYHPERSYVSDGLMTRFCGLVMSQSEPFVSPYLLLKYWAQTRGFQTVVYNNIHHQPWVTPHKNVINYIYFASKKPYFHHYLFVSSYTYWVRIQTYIIKYTKTTSSRCITAYLLSLICL